MIPTQAQRQDSHPEPPLDGRAAVLSARIHAAASADIARQTGQSGGALRSAAALRCRTGDRHAPHQPFLPDTRSESSGGTPRALKLPFQAQVCDTFSGEAPRQDANVFTSGSKPSESRILGPDHKTAGVAQ